MAFKPVNSSASTVLCITDVDKTKYWASHIFISHKTTRKRYILIHNLFMEVFISFLVYVLFKLRIWIFALFEFHKFFRYVFLNFADFPYDGSRVWWILSKPNLFWFETQTQALLVNLDSSPAIYYHLWIHTKNVI